MSHNKGTVRIDSLDLFRGLTILAMIWVNDLAQLRDLPAWLAHAPASADAMTFPDVVFPAFLFIVGMSIPIALDRRRERGEMLARTLLHILGRTAGLLIIGVLMVNVGAINPEATGLGRSEWAVLMYLGVILTWNAYPDAQGWRRALFIALRVAGIALLAWLAAIYRGNHGHESTWIRTQWWGILGLIGWAYLTATLCYLLTRGHQAGIAGLAALGIALCIADKNGTLAQFWLARTINEYVSLGGHIGGHSAIVLTGVLAMLIARPRPIPSDPNVRSGRPVAGLLFMAAILLVAGIVLRNPYGVSKIRVTPAWCLYCSAICCIVYAGLYWLVDRQGYRAWGGLLRIAGSNALLAFILPPIVYGLLQILQIDWLSRFNTGAAGFFRSTLLTALMIALTAGLTRAYVRLRL
ncbi:MAG TPA: DUF5009 domain-containing protein [Phycisphaerae bacterium]|nr:DUF5009 domain-containing protein [Phycisphaerae bacterium]HOM52393.1 DUF5009 domain-containing protein [Phycisphaerae bacterium]